MSDVWYLFDPKHPARAEQVMQRLRVDGRKLVIERGTFAAWEVVRTKRVLMPSAIDARLAKAREQGLAIESDPFAVLDRLSARHPELEAAIQAIDDLDSAAGREALTVYADFLQSAGDARGTLAALQLRDSDGATREWLASHRAQLFGPLAADSWRSPKLRWRGGWIIGFVQLGNRIPQASFADLFRLPACACLRSLRGDWQIIRHAIPYCRTNLRRLQLDYVAEQMLDLGELPQLDELVLDLDGGAPLGISLAATRVPKLFVYANELTAIHRFLDARAIGPLDRFGFRIPWDGRPEELRALLGHAALLSLRELELMWNRPHYDGAPFDPGPLPGPLLDVLLEAPLLHRVERRDLWDLEMAEPQQLLDAFASAPGITKVRSPE